MAAAAAVGIVMQIPTTHMTKTSSRLAKLRAVFRVIKIAKTTVDFALRFL